MNWKKLLARKSIESLREEADGEQRLHRALGPVALTSLGVGAIVGAGIFVMTGRVAAVDAGPAVVVSYLIAATACALAAFCYAEFSSMAPVAGSAYTYAYATLGEVFAWIIGWDLILEYGMSSATVASAWSKYFNTFLDALFGVTIPGQYWHDPFTLVPGTNQYGIVNLPAIVIMALITSILIIGIRESARMNNALVLVKIGVVLFVIAVGFSFVNPANWTTVPTVDRFLPGESSVPSVVSSYVKTSFADLTGEEREKLGEQYIGIVKNAYRFEAVKKEAERQVAAKQMTDEEAAKAIEKASGIMSQGIQPTEQSKPHVEKILERLDIQAVADSEKKWGMLAPLGVAKALKPLDESIRSSYFPYGLSGVMLGASLVFFAFIGFDSISTQSEEAKNPSRDVPIGILASLFICTILYIAVSAVITGMQPYHEINQTTAVASAFTDQAIILEKQGKPASYLRWSSALIAVGGLAGLTSVLLVTFLAQSRIFLAMARDRLLPPSIFGAIHPRFKTPHISTFWTGLIICIVAGFTPIGVLEEMVNIGTLFAFAVVCAAVLALRIQNPTAHRPFRCPAVFIVAPLGVIINVILMLFLPIDTWLRLVIWLGLGLIVYFSYGIRHTTTA